jgi:hypothetical protein
VRVCLCERECVWMRVSECARVNMCLCARMHGTVSVVCFSDVMCMRVFCVFVCYSGFGVPNCVRVCFCMCVCVRDSVSHTQCHT